MKIKTLEGEQLIEPPPKSARLHYDDVEVLPNQPECLSSDPRDVANHACKAAKGRLTSSEKYQLLTNHFTPSANNCTFQHKWLRQYQPWLVYSKRENGGYCLPCVLFAMRYRGSEPEVLVQQPLTKAEEFLSIMQGAQPSISQCMNQALADTIPKNHSILMSIVATVILCGRQNLALRGRQDSLTEVEGDKCSITNHGNCWALIKFRIDAGDTVLANHLATAGKNATYTSAIIQNQLISVIGDHIRGKILSKVMKAHWFTVIADEVTDISNKEQLSIVLR